MSSSFDIARADFGRALRALRPYADDLVVIGGMAPILYRLVPGVAEAVVDPVATREVDWSTPPKLPTREDVVSKLLAAAVRMGAVANWALLGTGREPHPDGESQSQ